LSKYGKKTGNPRWAYDCYRRFIQMYSDVVMEVGKKYFEQLIDEMKEERGVKTTPSSPPMT
jgi:pyruvate,orthophosphate dikinase